MNACSILRIPYQPVSSGLLTACNFFEPSISNVIDQVEEPSTGPAVLAMPIVLVGLAVAASTLDSRTARPRLLSRELRELMLRNVDRYLHSDTVQTEWYSPGAEKLVTRLLSALPEAPTEPSKRSGRGNPAADWDDYDTEALFLLCRTQLGCLEASLKELDAAATKVAHVREKWESVSSGTPSQIFNENVVRLVRWLVATMYTRPRLLRPKRNVSANGTDGGPSSITHVSGEVSDLRVASDAEEGAAATAAAEPPPSAPPHRSAAAARWEKSPLGSPRTRLGMGARRRALLRSERAMATHAGGLHDLRVALRAAGGEWIEMGRWLGGPPMAEMDWEVHLDAERRKLLLRLCLRVTDALEAAASALHEHGGPYQLYLAPTLAPPPPFGANGDDALLLSQFAPPDGPALALIGQTRRSLMALQELRRGARHTAVAVDIKPPGVLQRHSLAWIAAVALAALAYFKLVVQRSLPPNWQVEVRRLSFKLADDALRFWRTHVTEPVKGIVHELFHGVEKTIEPSQVRETAASLAKMISDFIRDVYGPKGPPESRMSEEDLAEAMRRAAAGSMEDVMKVYERQVRAPIGGLLGGELLRALLLQVVQLKLLMEQEVEAVDRLLVRNDFNLQLMATVPAVLLVAASFLLSRLAWRRARNRAGRDPIELLRVEIVEISLLLASADRSSSAAGADGVQPPPWASGDGAAALSQFEASPMALHEVGELVFRVQRLRQAGSLWLRGWLRKELMHDAQLLLDSGRLGAAQRVQLARSLLRRLERANLLLDHW